MTDIAVDDLRGLLAGPGELALLDVRESGALAGGTILGAVHLPLGRLERRAPTLVPRRATPVVVVDGDGSGDGVVGPAARAARRLDDLGYTYVRTLAGGLAAWAAAGRELFAGSQVVGQSFGEFVEEAHGTPHIDVATLRRRIAAGDEVVLLDSRPLAEFAAHALPGATSCPGAELAHRAFDLVPSPDALVVVNCAGRTRSILGAQTLVEAGLPNEVVALEGGTMSWSLAGLDLAHGRRTIAPGPTPAGRARAAEAAAALAGRAAVPTTDAATLGRYRAEARPDAGAAGRSLFVLDVRTPEEYAAGHLADARSTPSWELVPWVTRHVGTRGSRLVLVDDDLVRARVTAAWLVRMAWGEVSAGTVGDLADADAGATGGPPGKAAGPAGPAGLVAGAWPRPAEPFVPPSAPPVPALTAGELAARLAAAAGDGDGDGAGVTVLTVEDGAAFAAGHVPGSWFALRSWLPAAAAHLPRDRPIVVTATDPRLASWAAADLAADLAAALGPEDGRPRPAVLRLDGGTPAWAATGRPLATGADHRLGVPDDAWVTPWDEPDPDRRHAAFRAYLSWEVDLAGQLRREDAVRFRTLPTAPPTAPTAVPEEAA